MVRALYLRLSFETCSEVLFFVNNVCSYLRRKHKLSTLPGLSDFTQILIDTLIYTNIIVNSVMLELFFNV